MAPNLGAPGWASCSWGYLGRSRHSTASTFLFPFFCVFFRLLKGTSWFLKHSLGDILVKMQYFCHVMLFPHLTLATLSQQSTAPPCPAPTPLLALQPQAPRARTSGKGLVAAEECQQ